LVVRPSLENINYSEDSLVLRDSTGFNKKSFNTVQQSPNKIKQMPLDSVLGFNESLKNKILKDHSLNSMQLSLSKFNEDRLNYLNEKFESLKRKKNIRPFSALKVEQIRK